MIYYDALKPSSNLGDYIQSYWHFSINTQSHQAYDILPDGFFDLMIVFKGDKIHETVLAGLWSTSITINYTASAEVIGIRFKLAAIHGLLKFKIEEFLNNKLDIH